MINLTNLPKNYDHATAEKKWQDYWIQEKLYRFSPDDCSRDFYIIDTPPPTVSGNMHIGHAFSYTQQDFIARFKRMSGFNVYYPFGTDDNGLPTERLVEKLKKVKSTRMDRPAFVRLCQETIREIKDDFISDWIRIGMSCDFSRPYSTIDSHCVKTSQKSFLDLVKKGLVYRKAAPSMWCVNCQTAIAQAELEDKELGSSFNDVVFGLKDGGQLTIATTRPELLPACVCVFVHPGDKRYAHLVGKQAVVPLFGQEVPIFADESADPEKGTGILMICSYGDRFDVDAIQRKGLEPRVCVTKDGKLNEFAKQFNGMSLKGARKAILDELDAKGLLESKKSITHSVNVHDKCGTEIEFLATEQWFIKVIENKEKFLEAGNKINWYPQQMKLRYEHWVKNLNWDWCVSRQRHFGVPFPVWYSKKTEEPIFAAEDELPVDPLAVLPRTLPAGHIAGDIVPEKDVMDTWATSSVSPQIISNWIGTKGGGMEELQFKKLYPASLRPQAHDIIRTWAFYTIVKGVYHHNVAPWKDIVVSGNVSDPRGEKMSKSKGNVVDPRVVIEKYGADALRFWAAGSKLGEDLAFQEKDFVAAQKMIVKLWNASKFSLMHLEGFDYCAKMSSVELHIVDKWLIAKLNALISECTDSFDQYEYSKSKAAVEKFFWQVFCDNYLEFVKYRLYNIDPEKTKMLDPEARMLDPEARKSGQYTLYAAIRTILKLLAPIMPYISEEIYQLLCRLLPCSAQEEKKSIHISSWPKQIDVVGDAELGHALRMGDILVDIVAAVRKFKSFRNVSLKTPLELITVQCSDEMQPKLEEIFEDIKQINNAKKVVFGHGDIVCDEHVKIGILL